MNTQVEDGRVKTEVESLKERFIAFLFFHNLRPLSSALTMVSIQLISPTRGDQVALIRWCDAYPDVSIQLISPTRGDLTIAGILSFIGFLVSIQLISPTRGDLIRTGRPRYVLLEKFPFN